MRVESEKGVFLLHLSLHNRLFSLSGPHFPHLKKIRGTPLSRWRIKKAHSGKSLKGLLGPNVGPDQK